MQLAKRLVGMHPDKILGALEKHIDEGHGQSALQAIPDLQLSHPQFHNELERIKNKLSDKLLDDVKVLDREQAQVFRCVNCGGGLARQSPETVHVICQYCGCDAEHPAADRELERWNLSLDLEANFTIGDFFTFEGVRWQAVGVQLFSGRVREYDSEDGWETHFSRYTNWWMLNEQRELAWLIDDGSRRYWAEKYIPQQPSIPEEKDRNYEHGQWQLEFAAGEFSYQPVQGERHNSAEFSKSRNLPPAGPATQSSGQSSGRKSTTDAKKRYYTSVETRLKESGEAGEIEFIKSRMIPHSQMLAGLGNDSALQDRIRWGNTSRALMVALPLLAASALYLNKGGEVTRQSAAVAKGDKAVQLMEFKVDKPGQLYKLKGSINGVQNNSWFGVDVSLLDSDNEDVYGKYLEFWRESGRDADGYWSEAQLSKSWHVRVDEPGTYRVLINADEQSTSATADFNFAMEPDKTSLTPFMIAGFLSFLLIMLSRSKMASVSAAASSIALQLNKRLQRTYNKDMSKSIGYGQ